MKTFSQWEPDMGRVTKDIFSSSVKAEMHNIAEWPISFPKNLGGWYCPSLKLTFNDLSNEIV